VRVPTLGADALTTQTINLGACAVPERPAMQALNKTDYDSLSIDATPVRDREWYWARRQRRLGKTKGKGRADKFREIAKHKPVTPEQVIADGMPRVYESEYWFHVWNSGPVLCVYCNVELDRDNKTQDHVIPRAHGGSNLGRENLMPCCQYCNWAKADEKLLMWLFLSGPAG